MAEFMAIGTQLLALPDVPDRRDGPAAGEVPPPGRDGTLLAVVPIPGTQTSLAIVGYAVPAPAGPGAGHGAGAGPEAGAGHGAGPEAGAGHGAGPEADTADLVLDRARRLVLAGGHEVALTFQEFELLSFLTAHPYTVFSRAELASRVWQRDFGRDSRTVDVHIARLRHKLGPACGRCLVTEYRVGYQFRPLPPDRPA